MVSQHHLQHILHHMYIGYARVSTEDQNLDIQVNALKQAGCKILFQEKLSGAHRQRPELAKVIEQLREGDAVVIWKLDRLARSTRDLLQILRCNLRQVYCEAG